MFLSWNAPLDARVIGYRIYRFDSSRVVIPVGSSFEPDFADLFGSLDATYQYAVTSFDDQGQESILSNTVEVHLVSLTLYIPLIRQVR